MASADVAAMQAAFQSMAMEPPGPTPVVKEERSHHTGSRLKVLWSGRWAAREMGGAHCQRTARGWPHVKVLRFLSRPGSSPINHGSRLKVL